MVDLKETVDQFTIKQNKKVTLSQKMNMHKA